MKKPFTRVLILLCSAVLLCSPVVAAEPALELVEPEPQELAPVIITEVQTGAVARADEFIELHNTTDEAIDLTGWQVRYVTASATSAKTVEDPSAVIVLAPPVVDGAATLVPAGGYYVLYAGAITLPADVLGQQYEGVLPATGGSLVLVRPDAVTCEFVVEDAIAWGNTTHLFGKGEALVAGTASGNDRFFARFVVEANLYVGGDSNAQDFYAGPASISAPTIGVTNTTISPTTPPVGSGVQSQALPERFTNPNCTIPDPDPPLEEPPVVEPPGESPPAVVEPPEDPDGHGSQPTIPARNRGLKMPMLSEVLPNPAAPQTDKDDEFIELYNPNDVAFELSGYVLEVGLKTKKRFTIPAGTLLPARTFLAFFSTDSNLALSNSGSQVAFVDPLGTLIATSMAYGSAKDGQSWVFANGVWQWTTKPTPNALNVVSAPAIKKTSVKKASISTTGKTTSSSTPSSSSKADADVQNAAAVTSINTPLHPGVLAAIAVSAILYGAYEYRHDMANRLYQFRTNRAARRAAREGIEGR